MIVLHTNVVSEVMKPDCDPRVRAWMDEQAPETLFLTSITVAEIFFGIAAMPKGKRQDRLQITFDGVLKIGGLKVLPFDNDAARHYAGLALLARKAGLGFPAPDSYIAAIAAAHNFIIATRDAAPFEAAGLEVIDLWA
jgi:toxin FitB